MIPSIFDDTREIKSISRLEGGYNDYYSVGGIGDATSIKPYLERDNSIWFAILNDDNIYIRVPAVGWRISY